MKKLLIPVLIVIIGGFAWFVTREETPAVQPVTQRDADDTTVVRDEEAQEEPEVSMNTSSEFKDGTYRSLQMYRVPNGQTHDVDVTVTLENGQITEYVLLFDDGKVGGSTQNQDRFAEAIPELILGEKIDELDLSRVGGSSLTTDSFNDGLAEIMNEASDQIG